ncbi:MAG: hypothetical protein OHK0015_19910 [Chloroflexi bacterium OHK40]
MERYLVFARDAYAEPLSFQGALEAPAASAPELALSTYGDTWLELVLIPEREVVWAIEEPAAPASLEAAP